MLKVYHRDAAASLGPCPKQGHNHKRGMHMDAMRGGQILKALRIKAGLTQDQLAERAGVERLVLLRIEKGMTASPTLEAAVRLGRVLGLNADQVAELFEV